MKLSSIYFYGIFTLIVLCSRSSDAMEQILVKNGNPESVIVISSNAVDKEREAAEVLQKYVEKISGARLLIIKDNEEINSTDTLICIGKTKYLPEKIKRNLVLDKNIIAMNPINDSFTIATLDKKIFLCGHRPLATLFSVYDFLEELGCRWFFGCEAGIIIPKTETIRIANIDKFEKPSFSYRHHYSWYSNVRSKEVFAKERVWHNANKLNAEKLKGSEGHNMRQIYPPTLYKEHPEYFSLIKRKIPEKCLSQSEINLGKSQKKEEPGKIRWNPMWGKNAARGDWQPCFSNPDVTDVATKWAFNTMSKNPDFNVVTFAPNDGYGHCECEKCTQLGNIADRNIYHANQVGKKFFKQYPDKMIYIWAYAAGAQIPNLKIDGYESNNDKVLVSIYTNFSPTPFKALVEGWTGIIKH